MIESIATVLNDRQDQLDTMNMKYIYMKYIEYLGGLSTIHVFIHDWATHMFT